MRWHSLRRSRFQNRTIGIDPLADWLFRAGLSRAHDEGGTEARSAEQVAADLVPLRVLVRLAPDKSADDLAQFRIDGRVPPDGEIIFDGVTAKDWRTSIAISPLYREPKGKWIKARYCTARIKPVLLGWLADYPQAQAFVDSVTISAPPTPVVLPQGNPLAGGGLPRVGSNAVVVGLIDDGVCMASERFRTRNGDTRLMSAWLQTEHQIGSAPERFRYGREIFKSEFDFELGRAYDEDDFYRRIGFFNPQFEEALWPQYRVTHATHVLDTAAGYPADSVTADIGDRPIMAVQLPEVVVDDGSGHSLGYYVLDGLRYIVDSVEEEARDRSGPPAAVVVNISYGNNASAHDGSSDLERAMDEMIEIWTESHPKIPFVIVLPAGNSFQAQGHARLAAQDLANNCSQTLMWKIQPDDGTASIVQIWLPPGFPRAHGDRCSLQIMTPDGLSDVISTTGDAVAELRDDDGRVLAQAVYSPPTKGQPRAMFQIVVAPTVDPEIIGQDGQRGAPHGAWRLTLTASGLRKHEEIHAWIQRDDLLRRSAIVGRQSYFEDDYYQPVQGIGFPGVDDDERCAVKRDGSLNALANGKQPVVVGAAFDRIDMAACIPKTAHYSGGGNSGAGPNGVDLVAIAEDSIVMSGVLGAGTRSSAHVRVNGTSVAAPAVVRAIADNIDLFRAESAKDAIPALLGDDAAETRHPRDGWGVLRRPARTLPCE